MKPATLKTLSFALILAGAGGLALAGPAGASAANSSPSPHTHTITGAVTDARITYPLDADPLVWLEQKVSASDGTVNSYFGSAAAIEGATAIIGADGDNGYQGAAYVFTDSNGSWSEDQKLTASDGLAGDEFGYRVALDDDSLLVGAFSATVNGVVSQGAAYVFTGSGGVWTEAQKLLASDGGLFDDFGASVALDGNTLVVGANGATVGGDAAQGAVYVFTKSNGTWTQTQKLIANDGAAYDNFGFSVALEGTTVLVGSPRAAVNGNAGQGAVYVFTESGGTWSQVEKLIANDGAGNDQFGESVALGGNTALIGANEATVQGNALQGAAYEFTESDGTWTQTQKLTANDGSTYFGNAIALDGDTALIGADGSTIGGNSSRGKAYVFTESGGTWTQVNTLIANDGTTDDFFGAALALNGSTALISTPHPTIHGNSWQGAAYFYGASDLGLAVSAPQTVAQGQTYVSQTVATNNASAASPAVSATITVPAAASFVSATASQGICGEASGVVTCDFGQINGNAGTATANVTLKATGNVGNTIENVSGIAKAEPPLSASAATTITAGGACPGGYTEYDGNLDASKRTHSPIYQAPAGMENAILTGPTGFQLYAVFQNAQGRKIYRIPGNEVHRQAPAGTFTWVVKAGNTGGAYTLCVLHP